MNVYGVTVGAMFGISIHVENVGGRPYAIVSTMSGGGKRGFQAGTYYVQRAIRRGRSHTRQRGMFGFLPVATSA